MADSDVKKIEMPIGDLTTKSVMSLAEQLGKVSKEFTDLLGAAQKMDAGTKKAMEGMGRRFDTTVKQLEALNKLAVTAAKFQLEQKLGGSGTLASPSASTQAKVNKETLAMLTQIITGSKQRVQAEELLGRTSVANAKKMTDVQEILNAKKLEQSRLELRQALGKEKDVEQSKRILTLLDQQLAKQQQLEANRAANASKAQRDAIAEAKRIASLPANTALLTLAAQSRLPKNLDSLSQKDLKQLMESRTIRQGQMLDAGSTAKANTAANQYNLLAQALERVIAKEKEHKAALAAKQRELDAAAKAEAKLIENANRINGNTTLLRQEQKREQKLVTENQIRAVNPKSIEDIKKLTSETELYMQKQKAILLLNEAIAKGDLAKADAQKALLKAIQDTTKALHDQAKVAQQNAQKTAEQLAAEQRARTRARLFGDGGASLMLTQAGLMGNYQILSGLQSMITGAISASVKLDQSFRNLQAITATTNSEMVSLKGNLIEVAKNSKFSAVEIADAAVLLGQAGLSATQIEKSMQAITLLAQATGTDIKNSVDVTTSVLSIFDKDASQTADIANKLVIALNTSKLDIQKLALGLQYAGNTAADSGVSFEELTASLGALANAGIRSGSTLGTGLSQIFIDLQKPSENMKAKLAQLGLTMDDIDIRSKGFANTLHTLKTAGFTVGDAFTNMQVRSARAYAALVANEDVYHNMIEELSGGSAAMEANAIQMGSLANQYARFKNNAAILASEALEPLNRVLKVTFESFANFIGGVEESTTATKALFTVIGSLGLVIVGSIVSRLVAGMYTLAASTTGAAAATVLLRNAQVAFNLAATAGAPATYRLSMSLVGLRLALSGVFSGLLAVTGGWVGFGIAVAIGIASWAAYNKEAAKTNDILDKQKAKYNTAKESYESNKSSVDSLNEALAKLQTRQRTLGDGSQDLKNIAREMQQQFKDLGLDLEDITNLTLPDLIAKVRELRDEMAGKFIIDIQTKGQEKLKTMRIEQFKRATEQDKGDLELYKFLGSDAFKKAPPELQNLLEEGYSSVASRNTSIAPRYQAIAASNLIDKSINGTTLNAKVGIPALAFLKANPQLGADVTKAVEDYVNALNLLNVQVVESANYAKKYNEVRDSSLREQQQMQNLATYQKSEGNIFDTVINPAKMQLGLAKSKNSELMKQSGGSPNPVELEKILEAIKGEYYQKLKEAGDKAQALLNEIERTGLDPLNQKMTLEETVRQAGMTESDFGNFFNPIKEEAKKEKARGKESQIEAKRKEIQAASAAIQETEYKYQLDQAQAKLNKLLAEKQQLENENIPLTSKGGFSRQVAVEELIKKAKAERDESAIFYEKQRKKIAANQLADRDRLNMEGAQAIAAEDKVAFDKRLAEIEATKEKAKDLGVSEMLTQAELRLEQLKSGLEGGFTSATEVTLQERKVDKLKQQEKKYLLEIQEAFIQQLELQLAAIKEEILRGTELQSGLTARVRDLIEKQKTTALSDSEKRELEQGTKTLGLYAGVLSEKNTNASSLEEKLNGARSNRQELQNSINYSPRPVGERADTLTAIKNKYRDVVGQYDDMDTLADTFSAGLDSATQGFSDFFQTIVTGAGSARDAFEAMGKGILQSMLKVVSDRLAVQFIQLLTNLGGAAGNTAAGQSIGSTSLSLFKGLGLAAGSMMSTGSQLGEMTFGTFYRGGHVKGFAQGGSVGSIGRDNIRAMLQPNEFVLKPSAVDALGVGFLENLNQVTSQDIKNAGNSARMPAQAAPSKPSLTNVYVVSPDQVPPLTKDDVIVHVADNIQRNGSLKTLVKQVVAGG